MMCKQIAILGSSDLSLVSDIMETLYELGAKLAEKKCVVLAGSCGGIGNIVSKAAKEKGSFTIGISPYQSRKEHNDKYGDESECFNSFIYTGSGFKSRNVILVNSADAVIAVCGHVGTLNELTIAYDIGRPIGLLKNTGGIADKFENVLKLMNINKKTPIVHNQNPSELVDGVIQICRYQNETRNYCVERNE